MEMVIECGINDLTWRDLMAWAELTGTPLNSWESRAMIAISKTYGNSVAEYGGSSAPPPYRDEEFDREKVANQIRNSLRKRR
ncbi:MAG: hypothetical protein ACRCUH_10315 [Shewanella sp.]